MPLAAVVTSPLERTVQTADLMIEGRPKPVPRHVDERVGECRYGDWTGGSLKTLAKDPMWKVVQAHPSAAVFPGAEGESMAAMQHRAVSAVREWNERLGATAVYAVVSHGDVIKAILADALGMHLDQFQRIQVDPCSVSVVNYTSLRPFVIRTNDTGGSLGALRPPARAAAPGARRAAMRPSAGERAHDAPGIRLRRPDRFVVGTVGMPGERTFFLQARQGNVVTSVALEKAQVSVLAERVDQLLDEARETRAGRTRSRWRARPGIGDSAPLDVPIVEEFRVGAMALGWDEATRRVVIEAHAVSEDEDARDPRHRRRRIRTVRTPCACG